MTPRSIRRAAERKAEKLARKANSAIVPTAAFTEAPPAPNRQTASDLQTVSGLTGRTVLLPSGEASRYEQHLRDYVDELRPVGPQETALVQAIADTAWRLRRIPELENGIYALGHAEQLAAHTELCTECKADAPDTRLFELQTFLKYEKQLRHLQTQESRLRRNREKDMAELRALQAERLNQAKEAEAPKEAEAKSARNAPNSQRRPGGFVFANAPTPGQSFHTLGIATDPITPTNPPNLANAA